MIAVIQRVTSASVSVAGKDTGCIGPGLLILLGIESADTEEDIGWLTRKIVNLRIFDDGQGVMNLSCKSAGGGYLVVSQFTLHASTKKGNRPSYTKAAQPAIAIPRYESFVAKLSVQAECPVETGKFGADMQVSLVNDGPVTIIIDSKDRK